MLEPLRCRSRPIRLHFARAAGLSLVALLMAAAAFGGIASAQPGGSQHEAQDRAEAARAEEAALAGDIAAQSERIDAVERQIGGLRAEVAVLEAQLGRSRARLRALEVELAQKTRELARARRQLGIAQRDLNRRLVDIYTSGEADAVAAIVASESLEEVLDNLETRSRIAEYDEDLVQQITATRTRVRKERARTAVLRKAQAAETARLAATTNARREVLSGLVAQRDALAQLRAARQQALAAVQVERREWEAQADALETQSASLASAVATGGAAPPTTSPPSSGSGFIWPVRGTLISPYGQRWGRLHSGIDIAAPAGTPIAASASGTVAYSGSMGGYGLIVVIQHAGGIATAYAHNSSNSVSVGQAVSQGQTIAAVGCTGHCFGDHVHFEVRVGGSPVDPMGYL